MITLATEKTVAELEISDGTADASKLLFFLPTAQSCRRFRESIAKYAKKENTALFPGKILPLSSLLSEVEKSDNAANSAISLLVWQDILKSVDLSQFSALFPLIENQAEETRWRIGMAEKMLTLQSRLGEGALTIQDVACRENINEPDRWRDLMALEEVFLAKLADMGLKELNRAKIEFDNYDFEGIEKIIIAGIADPLPLALEKIKVISEKIPVEIWINAPEELSDKFDNFGRPLPDYWEKADIEIPDEAWIHLAGTAREQGDKTIEVLSSIDTELNADEIAICSANEELYSDIAEAFKPYNVYIHNPAGTSIRSTALFHLIDSFLKLAKKPDSESIPIFTQNPDFLRYFMKKYDIESSDSILGALDKEIVEYISLSIDKKPKTKNETLQLLFNELKEFINLFNSMKFCEFSRKFLADIYRNRELSPQTDSEDSLFFSAASNINKLLSNISASEFPDDENRAVPEVFITLLGRTSVYPEPPSPALDMHGWLEMPWEKAENIVIAGMNDGLLPESVVGDIFLPDTMMKQLGLNDNQKRFARDTFILQSLIEPRKNSSVNMIVGKQNKGGDPLKPSRLLFKCNNNILLNRAKLLFSESESDNSILTEDKNPSWQLKRPEFDIPVEKISVTQFKSYLQCPFRFYLQKCLKMEDINYKPDEMDARLFGTIAHAVLEKFGQDPQAKDSTDPKVIQKFLVTELEQQFFYRFGPLSSQPLPLLVQYDSLRQRFAKFAEIQAQERDAGWEIVETELKERITINGMVLSGQIDRIERNSRNGEIRVLDYKTIDSGDVKALTPRSVHLKKFTASSTAEEYAKFELDGKIFYWIDLQLPLYIMVLNSIDRFKNSKIHCGYFVLNKTMSNIKIYPWNDIMDYIEPAEECVKKIITNIQNKVFWPPNPKPKYENYNQLSQGYSSLEEAFECK
jgi:ATP-dependent helicase/nuclease subunit B